MMFDKEYSFRGKHAEYVVKLTAEYDDKHHKLFNTNYDVYAIAPIIGFLYQRKAELDKLKEKGYQGGNGGGKSISSASSNTSKPKTTVNDEDITF